MGESATVGVAVKTRSATEIKNRLGQNLADATVEPVAIEKDGRPVAVSLSFEENELLRRSDDFLWDTLHAREKRRGVPAAQSSGAECSEPLVVEAVKAKAKGPTRAMRARVRWNSRPLLTRCLRPCKDEPIRSPAGPRKGHHGSQAIHPLPRGRASRGLA
jgi:acyl-CoA hydrolase